MDELARLTIRFDARDVTVGAKALDDATAATKRTEDAAAKLPATLQKLPNTMSSTTAAATATGTALRRARGETDEFRARTLAFLQGAQQTTTGTDKLASSFLGLGGATRTTAGAPPAALTQRGTNRARKALRAHARGTP